MLLAAALAWSQVAVPALSARVIDLTGTLSEAVVGHIESEARRSRGEKGQPGRGPHRPDHTAGGDRAVGIRVADRWHLGRKNVDDGAILIVAKNDRRVRIEVGYGLEGALPDAIANRIIDEIITPRFKQGDFDGGVQAGVDRIIGVINGEPLPEPDRKWERGRGLGHLLPLLLVAVFVVSGVLRALFGRLFGSITTGGIAGALAYLMSHLLAGRPRRGACSHSCSRCCCGSTRGWSAGGGWGALAAWAAAGRRRRIWRRWLQRAVAAASGAAAPRGGGDAARAPAAARAGHALAHAHAVSAQRAWMPSSAPSQRPSARTGDRFASRSRRR
jgi:uncharacterized protein